MPTQRNLKLVEDESTGVYSGPGGGNLGDAKPSKLSMFDHAAKLKPLAKPIGLSLAAVLVVSAGVHFMLNRPATIQPDPTISPDTQRLIKENQQLREDMQIAQLEMMEHARRTRPWVLFNTCLWNCEGSDAPEPSPETTPEPSPSPSPSPVPSPTIQERVIERPVIVEKPVFINKGPSPSTSTRLLARGQLNIRPQDFKFKGWAGYNGPFYSQKVAEYSDLRANDPNYFYKDLVPQAIQSPFTLSVEEYDALYFVWNLN